MSLYSRLLPERKKHLLNKAKEYGSINEYLIPILKSKNFYHDLTISELHSIIVWTGCNTLEWNSGNWYVLDNIFTAE